MVQLLGHMSIFKMYLFLVNFYEPQYNCVIGISATTLIKKNLYVYIYNNNEYIIKLYFI